MSQPPLTMQPHRFANCHPYTSLSPGLAEAPLAGSLRSAFVWSSLSSTVIHIGRASRVFASCPSLQAGAKVGLGLRACCAIRMPHPDQNLASGWGFRKDLDYFNRFPRILRLSGMAASVVKRKGLGPSELNAITGSE